MLPHLLDLHFSAGTAQTLRYLELLLTLPVVLWAGLDYYRRGWRGALNRSPNMYTLIGLGVLVAYLTACLRHSRPTVFPPEMRDAHGMVGVYFEVAAVIIALVLLGEWLELAARGRTSLAIRQLLGLAPKTARRIRADGTEEDVPLDQLRVGDRVRVRPGEKVPVDGELKKAAPLSMNPCSPAKPLPVDKGPGDRVVGATRQPDRRRHRHRRACGRRQLALADRRAGRASSAQPRAAAASGRSRLRVVRSRGHHRSR